MLLRSLSAECSVVAFRFQNMVLLKNTVRVDILVRSRKQPSGDFSRLYPGERVVLGDVTIDSFIRQIQTYAGTFLTQDIIDDLLLPTVSDVFRGGRGDLI